MAAKRIVIIGSGGFAREVRWLLEDLNRHEDDFRFLGYVVSDLTQLGEYDSTSEVLGDFDWLQGHQDDVDALAIGIGTPSVRMKVFEDLSRNCPKVELPALIHPSVQFDRGTAELGRSVILCAGTIGTVNIHVDDAALVNLSCTLGHECSIGQGTVLNPTVNISGGVRLESGVLVGTGAQILQYLTIGAGATVGAGAVVTRNVEPGTTVVGVPATPLHRK